MNRRVGTRKSGRTSPVYRTDRLKPRTRGRAANRRRQKALLQKSRRKIILAAVALILFLLLLPGLFRRAAPQPVPSPGEPADGSQIEDADKSSPLRFLKYILGHEIRGLEPHVVFGGDQIYEALCMAVRFLTGIDPRNPCSVLDFELGVGARVSLPVILPSSSAGNGNGGSPEAASPNQDPAPSWGGSIFPFSISGSGEVPVLLYHTHASESFTAAAGESSSAGTVVTAGEELARLLEEEYGLPVLHHCAVYDLPRRHAYSKARPKIEKIIAENPGIEVVLDLHRDGVPRTKTTVTLEGKELAKILLVIGKRNPEYKENLAFALRLQNELDAVAPGLSRGILQQDFDYNQDLHPYALIIEVGGHENSITEALLALPYLAEALARTYYIFFMQD